MTDLLVLAYQEDENILYILNASKEYGNHGLPKNIYNSKVSQSNLYSFCKRYHDCDKDITTRLIRKWT